MTLRLIGREARADLPQLLCLALLVAVLTALCALGPALVARQEDQALRQRIATAEAQGPLLTLSSAPLPHDPQVRPAPMARLLAGGNALVTALGGPTARTLSVTGDGSFEFDAGNVSPLRLPDPQVTDATLALGQVDHATSHLRYLSGRRPADRTAAGAVPQIALSQETARALAVRTGSRLAVHYKDSETSQTVQVSGVFLPLQTADGFWTGQSSLAEPLRYPQENKAGTVLAARALLGTDGADVLRGAGVPGPLLTWQLHARLGPATVDGARALLGPLSSYTTDLNTRLCNGADNQNDRTCAVGDLTLGPLLFSDGLSPLITGFDAGQAQARTVSAFAVASLAAVALATAVLAVRLPLRRRDTGLRLQRARGASTARLVLQRSALAGPLAPISALLGWAVGRALAPPGTSGAAQPAAAALVALTALLLTPLLTWFAVRDPRTGAAAGRRVVLELTVLLAAGAGVLALRSQGATEALGAVPVLVALAATLALLRCYPPVLRLLGRQFRHGSGLLAFVALGRAARDASATGLALFVLVLTLGTAVFGGLVQRTVADGAAVGAAWATGSDAVALTTGNTTPGLDPPTTTGHGGVRTAVEQLHTLNLTGRVDGAAVGATQIVTVDPRRLLAVAPHSPLAAALLAALSAPARILPDGSTQLPFAATAALRARGQDSGFTAVFQAYGKPTVHLTLAPTGTLSAAELDDPLLGPITAALPPGTPLLITNAGEELMPAQSSGATAVLLHSTSSTPASPAELRTAAVRALGPLAQIRVRSETLAALRQDGLTRSVDGVYTACTVLAVLFALLALALELVLTSAERGRTTSFLRTLGLSSRAAGSLHLLQLVPLATLAAVAGVVLGLLEPRVIGEALNLRQFTGGPAQPGLGTDYRLTAALGIGVAGLVLGAAVVETFAARRQRLGRVLRLGGD